MAYTYSSSLAPTGSNPAREQFALISFSSIEALAECSRAEILVFNALALHADTEGPVGRVGSGWRRSRTYP